MPSSIQTRPKPAKHSLFLDENEEAHLSLRALREAAEEMSLFMERGVKQVERELRVLRLQGSARKHRSSRL